MNLVKNVAHLVLVFGEADLVNLAFMAESLHNQKILFIHSFFNK